MPKMKTHSGAKKRFKMTGTGKIRRAQANLGHLNETFGSTRLRRLKGTAQVSKADVKSVRKLLGKHKGR
ncbi:50S ribosomal protein L35 [Tessaracoccus sp. MC1865]|uniref:50S ribosomal protein L35 n=1 Tax=unclassified Tessaracoccus TaxID=2635419 RepID=UPI00096D26FD|nr:MULTISPECIES: 50S ribosomal protein L35 [unclassified Tessaracoccus]MBB1484289.1 50S ribosomal protein L35 [Tessaracoccus sp. MC1865]MBB1510783.1 50S ribosomal protein L35 [Tessaracoccus sp. MC1756]MCG6568662.1 50S ribosomal protein L35 [Tessaracoccus sp. ZS01]OMG51988.1 50S ribosomal protein L35 [Tessaracoccus sp. ZS01]QTO38592.1 50S ribosomal protein L35 [Tessaracoccus sp. MC1865]